MGSAGAGRRVEKSSAKTSWSVRSNRRGEVHRYSGVVTQFRRPRPTTCGRGCVIGAAPWSRSTTGWIVTPEPLGHGAAGRSAQPPGFSRRTAESDLGHPRFGSGRARLCADFCRGQRIRGEHPDLRPVRNDGEPESLGDLLARSGPGIPNGSRIDRGLWIRRGRLRVRRTSRRYVWVSARCPMDAERRPCRHSCVVRGLSRISPRPTDLISFNQVNGVPSAIHIPADRPFATARCGRRTTAGGTSRGFWSAVRAERSGGRHGNPLCGSIPARVGCETPDDPISGDAERRSRTGV